MVGKALCKARLQPSKHFIFYRLPNSIILQVLNIELPRLTSPDLEKLLEQGYPPESHDSRVHSVAMECRFHGTEAAAGWVFRMSI